MTQESGIYRVVKDKNYFVASNQPFNDARLSWEARGVMGYLLSKPDGWEIREADLINQGPAKAHKVSRIIKELKEFGYIRRFRVRKSNGTFDWVSEIYESPHLTTPRFSSSGSSSDGLSTTGKSGDIVSTEPPSTERVITERENGGTPPASSRAPNERTETGKGKVKQETFLVDVEVEERGAGHNEYFEQVCKLLGYNTKALSKRDREVVSGLVKAIRKEPRYTLPFLVEFLRDWWADDWRRKVKKWPTPASLQTDLGRYLSSRSLEVEAGGFEPNYLE
jgi:hypothetical protein